MTNHNLVVIDMLRKKKTRIKKNKKKGKYGEVVISKFTGAIDALRNRYIADFPDMILFSHFNALGKNFVFQRIESFPLKRIKSATDTHSVEFHAAWQSGGALPYIIPKTSFDIESKHSGDTVEWADIDYFGPQVIRGEFIPRSNRWTPEREWDKLDAEIDIRIDNIKSVNMYNWGFELIGEMMSLLAVNKNYAPQNFPKKISLNLDNLSFEFIALTGEKELNVRWSQEGYEPTIPINFDELLFEDNADQLPEIEVKDFGQRCMNNIILDDEE